MPASEFVFWQEHFSYFPFTFDRDDQRTAMMLSSLMYIEGRQLKNPIEQSKFIPDYLGVRTQPNSNKTIEQQQKEFAAFASKLKSMTGK